MYKAFELELYTDLPRRPVHMQTLEFPKHKSYWFLVPVILGMPPKLHTKLPTGQASPQVCH